MSIVSIGLAIAPGEGEARASYHTGIVTDVATLEASTTTHFELFSLSQHTSEPMGAEIAELVVGSAAIWLRDKDEVLRRNGKSARPLEVVHAATCATATTHPLELYTTFDDRNWRLIPLLMFETLPTGQQACL
jgi:hypothetical protein